MKFITIAIFTLSFSGAFASEVNTECSAMNESREKVVKTQSNKDKTSTSSAVISQ